VAGLEGGREPQMISIGSVLVGAELLPLLSRKLQVTEVVLQKPAIHLEVNKAGAANWQFASTSRKTEATPTGGARTAQAHGCERRAEAQGSEPAHTAATNVWVRNLRIDDGDLSYSDARSDHGETMHAISVRLDMPAAGTQARAQPVNINGNLTYNSEPLKVS